MVVKSPRCTSAIGYCCNDERLVAFGIKKNKYILFKFPPFFEHTFTSLHLFSTPISCLSPFFNHTFCCLPTFSHTFSCLPFFSHFLLPPLFSQTHSVVFAIQKKYSSPFFSVGCLWH